MNVNMHLINFRRPRKKDEINIYSCCAALVFCLSFFLLYCKLALIVKLLEKKGIRKD